MSAGQRIRHQKARHPYHVMIKAVGPICNLDCNYCYYLEKTDLYPQERSFRMQEPLLEQFVRDYIRSHPGPTVIFPWHGGEPTLIGIEFFRKAVALQQKYLPPGWTCVNVPQTNGTLLNEEWARFFSENNFAIGISIDGPAHLHDACRFDKRGRSSHEKVMAGLALLQKYKVPYSVLCVVNSVNVGEPLAVYRFFREHGVTALQFLPIVMGTGPGHMSAQTVDAAAYGRFLIAIFNEWMSKDVGKVWVQIFEEALAKVRGEKGSLCIFQETCGDSLAMEHNGDLFACDHYVREEFKLGNIHERSMRAMVDSPQMKQFANAKRDTLPRYCRECDVRFMCNGGCPKDRMIETPDGEPGLNYLCAGFQSFFRHARPRLTELDRSLRSFFPEAFREDHPGAQAERATLGRNDPCHCGSGRKYKQCCLRAG